MSDAPTVAQLFPPGFVPSQYTVTIFLQVFRQQRPWHDS